MTLHTIGSTDSIERAIFTQEEVAATIQSLAKAIAADYARQPLLLLGVLKGALYVTVDLARAISRLADGPSSIGVDYLVVSSYGNSSRSSGEVRMLKDTDWRIAGKNVVIVEDIIDNGLTLSYLQSMLKDREPASLRSCVLLDKPYRRQVETDVRYRGLTAPDAFVVGYGLDYQEKYRNLPFVAQLRAGVISE